MAAKKQTKKSVSKRTARPSQKSSRQITAPDYHSFKLSKRIRHPAAKLSNSFKLFKMSLKVLFRHKKLFLGIVFIYLVLTVVFVKLFSVNSNISELKDTFEELFTGGTGKLISTLAIFSLLVGTTSQANSETGSVYQSMLLIIISLAVIWALRQVHAGNKIGIRDAFYKGLYPLVPFILVLAVIGLQLLPLLAGVSLYGIVTANGLAVNVGEHALWVLLLGLFALLSLYMTSSSIFALYIVTLPDVRPMQALRSSRELVRYRRWTIMRKILFLPALLIIAGAIIMIPLILFVTPAAEWVFFTLAMFSLAVTHSYVYSLYRELLPNGN